jgi:hypothetical protein
VDGRPAAKGAFAVIETGEKSPTASATPAQQRDDPQADSHDSVAIRLAPAARFDRDSRPIVHNHRLPQCRRESCATMRATNVGPPAAEVMGAPWGIVLRGRDAAGKHLPAEQMDRSAPSIDSSR